MSEPDLPSGTTGDDSGDSSKTNFIRRQLPFIAVLTLVIAGVAYANIRASLSSAIGSSWLLP
jgi:hypothetical protein